MDPLAGQEADREARVHGPDVGEALHGVGPAEQLGFEPRAGSAPGQQVVDQQFHGVDSEMLGVTPLALAPGQQEVVHAADPRDRIVQAGRHAGSEQRRHAFARVLADPVLALHDVDGLGRVVAASHCSAPNTASIFFFSSGTDTGFLR